MSVAVITGASRGLGRALALALAGRRWTLIVDARTSADLAVVGAELDERGAASVVTLAGSVAEPEHRQQIADEVAFAGGLDLLVNNASILGPSPQPSLANYPSDVLRQVFDVNALAPLALTQTLLPALRSRNGKVVNISWDAAVEPYEGWGGYGSSKAALDQLSAILGAEEPSVRVYAVDPGDMRTRMHQEAFPGEDISDRPEPETVVPGLMGLIDGNLPSGRYQGAALRPAEDVA